MTRLDRGLASAKTGISPPWYLSCGTFLCHGYNVIAMNRRENRQMATEAFSVRTDSKKVRQLDRIAKQQDRSRNYLVNQAIDHLLELHSWQSERVKEGIKAADKGRFASDTDMARIFNKYKNA